MEYLGLIFATVGFALALLVWVRSVRQQRRDQEHAEALEAKINRANAATRSAQESADREARRSAELGGRVSTLSSSLAKLESDLALAVERRDERRIAKVMWALELERSYRQWREVIVPTESANGSRVTEGQQLSFALQCEAERLRDEVGVSIRASGMLHRAIEAEIVLGTLRITEELLSLVAKYADEVDLGIRELEPDGLEILLICSGWDHEATEEAERLQEIVTAMARRLEGAIDWTPSDTGDLTVIVRMPTPAPEGLDENETIVQGEETIDVRTSANVAGRRSADQGDADGISTDKGNAEVIAPNEVELEESKKLDPVKKLDEAQEESTHLKYDASR